MNFPRATTACAGLIVALQAVLVGCGAGSASSSTSTTASSATGSAAPPSARQAESSPGLAAERRAAGRAAAFVEPGADNSVPTFGAEASPAQRAQAGAALRAYLRARAAADWAAACRRLAASVRQGYEKLARSSTKQPPPGCAAILAALSKGADLTDPLTGALLALRVKGADAFALFYGPGHRRYMVPMNREAGAWSPTQATPIAYPPATP